MKNNKKVNKIIRIIDFYIWGKTYNSVNFSFVNDAEKIGCLTFFKIDKYIQRIHYAMFHEIIQRRGIRDDL